MSWKKVSLLGRLMGKTPIQVDVASLPTSKDPLSVTLGGVNLTFENGEWSAAGVESGTSGPTNPAMKRELQRLQAENEQLKEQLRFAEFRQNVLIELLAGARLDLDELGKECDTLTQQMQTS